MPEIDEECQFTIEPDQLRFQTQTNGDELRIRSINLDAEQAAALAWLVNQQENLVVEIRIATP